MGISKQERIQIGDKSVVKLEEKLNKQNEMLIMTKFEILSAHSTVLIQIETKQFDFAEIKINVNKFKLSFIQLKNSSISRTKIFLLKLTKFQKKAA